MKNKKGFTLIELLAVIVILAIIALIAVPIILNMINEARKSAAKSSALGYVDAIEYNNGFAAIEQPGYTSVTGTNVDVSTITVKLKGKKPSSGNVTIDSSGKVSSATLCINGYTVVYNGQDISGISKGCSSQTVQQKTCEDFSTDSWLTIVQNTYPVGCEKDVEIENNSYTVRIANTSTPEVCNTTGYSQTACGFVIEFVDIVGIRRLKESHTNVGGWKETEMVTYLNGDFYNSLPSDLKNVIIPTYPIVSGSGPDGVSENITASDTTKNKIYLLSLREVGFDELVDNKRNITTDTRTLDYYSINNDNDSKIKKDLSNTARDWWLRTAHSSADYSFFLILSDGYYGNVGAKADRGVAPAFRIRNN